MNFDKKKGALNEEQKVESCQECVKSIRNLAMVQNLANLGCDGEIDRSLSQSHNEILKDSIRAKEVLKIALSTKNIKLFKYLAKLGVKLGSINEIGDKALQLSYDNKLEDLVEELFDIYQMENGIAIGDCGHMRIKCIEDGSYTVTFMKSEDFDPINYNAVFGMRALMCLLKSVKDVNVQDSDGRTIMHRICYDVKERRTSFDNTFRLLAMHLLICRGADLNQTDSKENTPILCLFDPPPSAVHSAKDHVVVRQYQKDRLKILIDAGAELDVSSDQRGNQTPLHAVVLSKARDVDFSTTEPEVIFNDDIGAEMLEMLLLSETGGPDIDALNEEGRTALQEAVSYLNRDAVRVLLRHDADASEIVFQGGYFEDEIPLSSELIDNLNGIIELLIKKGFIMKDDDYEAIVNMIDPDENRFNELRSLMSSRRKSKNKNN